MVEPNRLTDPAERAARERVEVVFAAVDAYAPGQLSDLIIGARDPEERDRLLGILDDAVAAHGRDDLLDEACDAVRDAFNARINQANLAGPHGFTTISASRAEDRVEVIAAIEDAVAVAVAEDLLEPRVARALAEPGRALLGLEPLGDAGDEPLPARAAHRDWEPTADEWRDAAQEAEVDPSARLPGSHAQRYIFVGSLALVGVPAAIAGGIANGSPLIGILAAIAIGAVCWTLLGYRRAG